MVSAMGCALANLLKKINEALPAGWYIGIVLHVRVKHVLLG